LLNLAAVDVLAVIAAFDILAVDVLAVLDVIYVLGVP